MPVLSNPRHVARRRVATFLQHLPTALVAEAHGIHQARVSSRRLREIVPLLRAGAVPPDAIQAVRQSVRALTRALGPVRELDVNLAAIDDLIIRWPEHAGTLAAVRAHVATRRSAVVPAMQRELRRTDPAELLSAVGALAAACEAPARRQALAGLLAARVARRASEAVSALDRAGTVCSSEPLHRARIAVKKLRYVLEVAESMAGLRLTGSLARLKRLQDTLGRLHDTDVLTLRVRECRAATSDASAQAAFGALVDALDHDTRHIHLAYLMERETLGPVWRAAAHVVSVFEQRASPLRAAPVSRRRRPV